MGDEEESSQRVIRIEKIDLEKIKRFNEILLSDLYRRNVSLSLEGSFKNYLIVPFRLISNTITDLTYILDIEMVESVSDKYLTFNEKPTETNRSAFQTNSFYHQNEADRNFKNNLDDLLFVSKYQ